MSTSSPPGSALEFIEKSGSIVVVDSGEIEKIKLLNATDATTNPSLIAQAAKLPAYRSVVDDAIKYVRGVSGLPPSERMPLLLDKLAVSLGTQIVAIVPCLVSTEVDARLSFDAPGSIARGRKLIELYEAAGVHRGRVLIKLAATWEGIEAARELEKGGIRCNLTLIFSFYQALAAAQAGAYLISPFVGRILDWFKKADPTSSAGYAAAPATEPGVLAVRRIYQHFKATGLQTICMAASFRNVGEILALSGCDKLTISPALLGELAALPAPTGEAALETGGIRGGGSAIASGSSSSSSSGSSSMSNSASSITAVEASPLLTEAAFRWHLNEDAMATEKLAEGIRGFASDLIKLEAFLAPLLDAAFA